MAPFAYLNIIINFIIKIKLKFRFWENSIRHEKLGWGL